MDSSWESQKPNSSNPKLDGRYDIFLSFRGIDTRTKFTDHLYHALIREGFQTFRDEDDIEWGEAIKPELHRAIMSSRMSVIVISENYANSKACLFELQTILEQYNKLNHFVLPLFYEVDPSVVKEQSENLHFWKTEVTVEQLKRWSAALKEVVNIAGKVLEPNRYSLPIFPSTSIFYIHFTLFKSIFNFTF